MSRWRSIRRWGLRIIMGGLVFVMILAGIGWIWERSEEAAFREIAITPSGLMVPVGNHTLHVVASGRGATGVLLISGAGEDLRGWEKLQSRLSESTRVVSYDRPGFGWSPPREGDLTLDAAVEDVEGLLAAPGLFDGPPILIGHSLGGQIARHFAYAHPNAVARDWPFRTRGYTQPLRRALLHIGILAGQGAPDRRSPRPLGLRANRRRIGQR